jgi:two-component system OmpR family sensor kinase
LERIELSVLKSWDIDLPQSEKRTLYRFLALYIFLVLIILALTFNLYVMFQKEMIVKQNVIMLNDFTNELIIKLKEHSKTPQSDDIIKDDRFEVSLYDESLTLLASTFEASQSHLDQITYTEDTIVRYLVDPSEYYLSTKYLVVKMKQQSEWKSQLMDEVVIYGVLLFGFFVVVGYFLLTLFLKPMSDALYLLDRFIKDTTHELNTPVSTILTNIEMIGDGLQPMQQKAIKRIDLGAKTISNIYDDLTYLVLHHKIISDNSEVNLSQVIKDRIEYVQSLASIKQITILSTFEDTPTLLIDEKKFAKVVDNLLSNALKYNRVGGSIEVKLTPNELSIKDNGRGIKPEDIGKLFDRFARFDKSVGGFGIGLNIVKLICDEYALKIDVKSEIEVGTTVTISW